MQSSTGIPRENRNYTKMKAQLVVQLLTDKEFRDQLQNLVREGKYTRLPADDLGNPEENVLERIKRILRKQGYTETLAENVLRINFQELSASNITELLPDNMEVSVAANLNLNW